MASPIEDYALIALANDVGLLSKEYDPVSQRLVGNFPQAFTYVALINSVIALTTGESLKEPDAAARAEPVSG
jgi:GH15 family glucan-1,4-alpha-glucosidase